MKKLKCNVCSSNCDEDLAYCDINGNPVCCDCASKCATMKFIDSSSGGYIACLDKWDRDTFEYEEFTVTGKVRAVLHQRLLEVADKLGWASMPILVDNA